MKTITSLIVIAFLSMCAGAQPHLPATPSADKLGWQLAMHSYTFGKFPILQAIDKTAATGIRFMSLSGHVTMISTNSVSTLALTDTDMQTIQDKMKADGISLQFVNMGVMQFPPNEAKCREVFEFAKKYGIGIIVAEPDAAALDTVEKLCKEYNIKVAIHDHPKPSRYWNPDTVLEAIKGRTPLMGACADVGHWTRSGLNPVECLKKLEGHIICLHFKDLNEASPKAHDVVWGTGVNQVKAMMVELKRQNFHGAFCVEYEYNGYDSQAEIAQCVKFFNATCDELVATGTK